MTMNRWNRDRTPYLHWDEKASSYVWSNDIYHKWPNLKCHKASWGRKEELWELTEAMTGWGLVDGEAWVVIKYIDESIS